MKEKCYRHIGLVASVFGLLATATHGVAATEPYPQRPIRIIVNLAAGGGTDVIARQIAVPLSAALGQPVVVENKLGAGGNIGADYVAKSQPDGYTFLMTAPAPIAQAMVLYKKLPYNPQTDLRLVSDIAIPRQVCTVNPKIPVHTPAELIAWAKANPGKLTIGSWGVGTVAQAVQVAIDRAYGTQSVSVQYKGESGAVSDLLGGQIAMSCATTAAIMPHLEAGSLRAIAVIGAKRSAVLPNVPTFAEAGYADEILQITAPISLVAPAKTPPEVIELVGRTVAQIVKSPQITAQINKIGYEPVGNLPSQAQEGYNARLPVMIKSVRDIGVTID